MTARGTQPSAPPAPTAERSVATTERRTGTLYGTAAYLIWGVFPLYFAALRPAGPVEILAHRVVWSLVLCLGIVVVTRQLGWLWGFLRDGRAVAAVGLAGTLLAVNWTVYTFAVLTGHVTEAALGYFLNPLVTVALGVVVLGERLRPAQWVAVAIGLAASFYLAVDYGAIPWISLSLAFSFASYGLLKNRLGVTLSATQSLTGETLLVTPAAVVILVWLAANGGQTFTTQGAAHGVLLMSAGLATTVPLLLFAAAARRVPLVTIGLLQFVTPVMQLLCGVLLLGEAMALPRWVGFALVWVALIVLAVDSVLAGGRARRLGRAAEGAAV